MNSLPPALWSMAWQGAVLAVYDTGADSPLAAGDAAAVLSEDERARASRFHFARDRDRWIRSRSLLRLTLAHRLTVPAHSLTFQSGPHGKPSLPDHPGCHFNLSHSGDFTAVAVGTVPLGIDVESPRDDVSAASLAAHAFSPEEAAAVATSTAPCLLFYQLWTAKEAVMKCTGMGMSLPPDSISVRCGAGGRSQSARIPDGTVFDILTHSYPDRFVLASAMQNYDPRRS